MNAIFFRDRRKYDLFLIDNLHVTFPIMKMFGLLGKKQKIIAHLGSHTLFFMHSGKFSRLNLWLHKLTLRTYDALICEGQLAEELAKLILKEKCPPTYCTYLGPNPERSRLLRTCVPSLEGNTIVVIAAGPEKFREFYKGLDLMVSSFNLAYKTNKKLKLQILGNWTEEIKYGLLKEISEDAARAINFAGPQSNLKAYVSYLGSASLCLHCSRGDAFPTSTIETMIAGLPTIVSEWTGTKEIVAKVDNRLIVPLEINLIAQKINWYFGLSITERQELSDKGRTAVLKYNEPDAIEHYRSTLKKICKNLGLL
ncbi:MAG: glycosyltransferase [Bacteroidetes bacterium]|nr:glycosyltransferase [Bacteroidota bacterium]